MNTMMDEMLSTLAFAGSGVLMMAIGFYVVDLLTPGKLGELVFRERNRDAAYVLTAALLSVGGVVATAIVTAEGDAWHTLLETVAYGLLGIALLGLSLVVLDLLTPGRLGETLTDEHDDPAVFVAVAMLLGVGLIVMASLT